jgi:hypothetical protein
METSRSRAALAAWLIQAEEVLRGGEDTDTDKEWDQENVEHGDAA